MRTRVVLESPYGNGSILYLKYARLAMRDSLSRGEAPIASHLLYTQEGILNDEIPKERARGISAGHSWIEVADLLVVYLDYGLSEGMLSGIKMASSCSVPLNFRYILSQSR